MARPVTADDHGPACLIVAGLGSLAPLLLGTGPAGLAPAALALVLLAGRIAWQDLTDFTIPDSATLALALVGVAWRVAAAGEAGEGLPSTFALLGLDALLCGGALWVLREIYYRRRGQDGIGLGDVKLAAAGGILVGTGGFAWCLLGASLVGIVLLLGRRALAVPGVETIEARLAFGAVLAPALVLGWLAALFA
ncbi:prepilin peptidase [Methylobacterium sp. Leaf118]|uniref:prepilin peptidase n=1 Tax=Methylobacterium sp. Leaf118 TaxID=2876562 RepID=UPI001E4286B0|nr:prepilin peptidase [Methylobacterium sp. Leaf118]